MGFKNLIIEKVNSSNWWHVSPLDDDAYTKRGKFLASTYQQAEFYGRPESKPEKVSVANPLFGFSELEILKKLFPAKYKQYYQCVDNDIDVDWYKRRINLDKKMFERAKKLGHDAIVLMAESGKKSLKQGRKPNSIELNIIK